MSAIEAPPRAPEVPDTGPPIRPKSTQGRRVGAWPIASRLARREVQRRPGRTILVMLLVVLPVFFMTVGSVLVRSDTTGGNFGGVFRVDDSVTASSGSSRFFAEASIIGAEAPVPEPFSDDQVAALTDVFGDRAEIIRVTSVYSEVASPIATEFVELIEWPAGVSDGIVETGLALDSGRAPSSANEVLLSRSVANAYEVEVGDELVLTAPERRWDVVGIGRNRQAHSEPFAYVGRLDRSDIVPSALSDMVVVVPVSTLTLTELQAFGDEVQRTLGADWVNINTDQWPGFDDDETKTLAWGWVGGVVSLIAVGVVISAAFATSARRQLATVGQLSANGAPAKVIERSLALQGSWTGVLGSTLGIGLGLVAVLSAWALFEELLGYELPNRQIAVIDLVVIAVTATTAATIAALFPAKSAARVPVLTALAGRRPVGVIPRWLVPLGLISTTIGVGLLALVAFESRNGGGEDLAAFVSVVGAVSVMVGLICASPILIETAGRIGHRWPGSLLLAVRSLARQRMRSAAVVSAISVVMALSMAGLTGMGVAQSETEANTISNRTIKAQRHVEPTADEVADQRPPQSLIEEVDTLVPDAQRVDVQSVRIGQFDDTYWLTATVATDDVVPFLGLNDANLSALRETGLGTASFGFLDGFGSRDGGGAMVGAVDGVDVSTAVQLDVTERSVTDSVIWFDYVVSPEWVAEQNLEAFTSEVLWVNSVVLNAEQRRGANLIGTGFAGSAFISVIEEIEPNTVGVDGDLRHAGWHAFSLGTGDAGFPWGIVRAAALAASLLLVLGVVAIGLGLAAVESRDERAVLHVVGAPPSVLRRVAAAKTWVLTTSAALVAVPTGFIVVWVVRAVSKMEFDPHAGVPWLAAISLLVFVPALAAAATWIGSGVAAQVRPVTASRMRLD